MYMYMYMVRRVEETEKHEFLIAPTVSNFAVSLFCPHEKRVMFHSLVVGAQSFQNCATT